MVKIETERLIVQPMTRPELSELIESTSTADPELSEAYTEMRDGCDAHPEEYLWYAAWKAVLRDSGEFAGDLCFKGPANGKPEIGYGIIERYQNRGYATEAARAMCAWALTQPGVEAVEAETDPDNAASQKVLGRLGFVPTGETGKEGPRFILRKNHVQKDGVTLETERLILRELREDDLGALYVVLGDSDIMRHYPYTFDEARVRRWIAVNMERYRVFGFGLWAVVLKETGELIGDCGLTMQSFDGMIRPEIGYHIARSNQRKGYAKEAAAACRDWAFENTPFGAVYSYMKKDNTASRATAAASGMRCAGEFTDTEDEQSVFYEITRAEWRELGERTEKANEQI